MCLLERLIPQRVLEATVGIHNRRHGAFGCRGSSRTSPSASATSSSALQRSPESDPAEAAGNAPPGLMNASLLSAVDDPT